MKLLLFILIFTGLSASSLHLSISSSPTRLNPLISVDSSSGSIVSHIFSGLIKYDKDASTIVSDLADEFYYLDDKTLIFKLKENVKWHDGVEFSAKDVLFTYKSMISKKIFSPYSNDFRFVESVEIVDKFTVKIKYKKPYFKSLEIWMLGIIPMHILKDEENMMNSKFNKSPIGTGPYKLLQLEYGKNIILVANDDFYESRPKIDKIFYHIVADQMTRFLMLQSLQIDTDTIQPIQYEKRLQKDFFDKFNIYERITNSYTYLGFNLRKDIFKDARVRKAISLAIDRQEIIDILFFKHAQICTGPFLPTTRAFNKEVLPVKQDTKKALELLKDVGYDKKNPLRFEITTSNNSDVRNYAAQIIQYQLNKIGIEVSIRVMEWQAFLNTVVFPHNFDTVILGWGLSALPDPYSIWHSDGDKKGGFNIVGYKNKEVDNLIDNSQSVIDKNKLSIMQKKIFKLIVDDNPYLFLYIPNSITAINKNVKNVSQSPSGIWHNYIKWGKDTYK